MNRQDNYLQVRRLGLLVAALTLLADVLSKGWIYLNQERLPIDIIPGFFSFVLAWNRGMSFSFLSDAGAWGPLLLGGLAVLACAWFVHWMGKREAGSVFWQHQLGLGLLTGGALGNVVDRVYHGAVVDFILFYVPNGWYFPVFNIADTAISAGVGLLLWDSLRQSFRGDAAAAQARNTTT